MNATSLNLSSFRSDLEQAVDASNLVFKYLFQLFTNPQQQSLHWCPRILQRKSYRPSPGQMGWMWNFCGRDRNQTCPRYLKHIEILGSCALQRVKIYWPTFCHSSTYAVPRGAIIACLKISWHGFVPSRDWTLLVKKIASLSTDCYVWRSCDVSLSIIWCNTALPTSSF